MFRWLPQQKYPLVTEPAFFGNEVAFNGFRHGNPFIKRSRALALSRFPFAFKLNNIKLIAFNTFSTKSLNLSFFNIYFLGTI